MTCKECIHKVVCYRVDSVPSDHARKCGDFVSGSKALEQEPCEDCISREAARDLMYHKQEPLDEYDLDSLLSVTPKQKEGQWVEWYDVEQVLHGMCLVCGKVYNPYTVRNYNYCPNCGSHNGDDKTLISEPIKRKGLKDILEDDPSLTEKISVEEFEARTGRKIILEETDDEND